MGKCNLKRNIKVIVSVLSLLLFTACGSEEAIMIDYADEAAFENALNNGENLEGKVVTFTAQEIHPDSTLGFDVWAGEHLNFVSQKNPDIAVGDQVTVKATAIENVAGSWVIYYEKVKNAVAGETTISSAAEDETAENVEEIPKNDISGWLLIGNQGSAITMYDDGTADYYWIEGGDVKTDNAWNKKDNVLTIQVPSLNCDIYAEWDGKNNTLVFQSDSLNWDEEQFAVVSQIQKKPTAEEYRQVILAAKEEMEKAQMEKENATSEESGVDSAEPAAEAPVDEGQTSSDQSDEEEKTETADTSSGDVDPDLKAFLDEYEAFMDDYVEFMKKYTESGSSVEMLSDYMTMMQRYADFASVAEKYNSEEMSAADAAYYLDVTTRISKKMLEVAY